MDDPNREVERRRVGLLFARLPIALLTVIVNGLVLGWLVADAVALPWLLGWIGATWAVSAGRAVVWQRHRKRPDARSTRAWERSFVWGAALNGLVWGSGGFAFVGSDQLATIAVVFVVGGMVAGASASTSVSMRAFVAFAAPAVLPVVAGLAWRADTLSVGLAAMLGLFGAAMAALARQGGRAIVESLRLEQRNAALVEEVRRASQQRFSRMRALLQQAHVGAVVADAESLRVLEASDNAAPLLGLSTEALVGSSLLGLGPLAARHDPAIWRRIATEGLDKEQVIDGIRVTQGREGAAAELELTVSVRDLDGHRYLLAVLRDVTERKALEAAVLESSMLASLGTLAAGVAHEINNPLSYILGNLQAARRRVADLEPEDRELVGWIDECIVGADRVARIVRDLTATARSAATGDEPAAAEVERVLDSCLDVADQQIRFRASVARTRGGVPPVRMEPLRLHQVVLNLLLNAAHAIDEGKPEDEWITVETHHDPERARVRIIITDTGRGIDEASLPRIFDPFFTTKEPGEGTGLGLSICHALVTGNDGELRVESTLGTGTTVTVELPVAIEEPAPPPRPAAPPSPPRSAHGVRVLIVDDEPLVRRTLERFLDEHDTVGVDGGEAALARIDEGERYDLVLCDLMMPGMSGMELHRQVLARDPAQAGRMVFMTGGAFTERSREFLARVPNPTIGKPFDLETIRQLPARVMRESGVDRSSTEPGPPGSA